MSDCDVHLKSLAQGKLSAHTVVSMLHQGTKGMSLKAELETLR